MRKFIVSSSPYIHSGNDVNKMFLYMTMALVLPLVFGYLFFGVNALLIAVVSIISCYFFELLYELINNHSFIVNNFSFFVTAMILALTLPYNTPILLVVAAAFFAIFVTKMVFGGLGKNKFNPALLGRCFAGILTSDLAITYYDTIVAGELTRSFTIGGTNTIYNLIMGQAVGGIGTTCILVILFCFVVLVYTDTVDYKITLFSVVSYFLVGLIFNDIEQNVMNMLSGSFIFVSVFVMTDPNTSPNSTLGKIVYSCIFGALSAVLWNYKVLGENTIFVAALAANFVAPMIDKYFRLKPITVGGFRNAYKV